MLQNEKLLSEVRKVFAFRRPTSVTRQLSGLWVERRVEVIVPRIGVGVPAGDGWDGEGELPHCFVLVREHVTQCWGERGERRESCEDHRRMGSLTGPLEAGSSTDTKTDLKSLTNDLTVETLQS